MAKTIKLSVTAGTNELSHAAAGFERFMVIKIHSDLPFLYCGEKLEEGKYYPITFPFQLILPVKYLRSRIVVEVLFE